MKTLGIDPGTNVTGYAVLEKNGNSVIYRKSGIIKLKKTDNISLKLKTLYTGITDIIDSEQPMSVALEDIFYYKNVKSTVKLAYAKGVIILAAAHKSLEVFEYTPTNVKSVTTGSGRASKDSVGQLLHRLVENLPVNFKTKDETDAIALAYCHLQTYSFEERLK